MAMSKKPYILVECTPLGKIGLMSPDWIEWLMGYRIGWTALDV